MRDEHAEGSGECHPSVDRVLVDQKGVVMAHVAVGKNPWGDAVAGFGVDKGSQGMNGGDLVVPTEVVVDLVTCPFGVFIRCIWVDDIARWCLWGDWVPYWAQRLRYRPP